MATSGDSATSNKSNELIDVQLRRSGDSLSVQSANSQAASAADVSLLVSRSARVNPTASAAGRDLSVERFSFGAESALRFTRVTETRVEHSQLHQRFGRRVEIDDTPLPTESKILTVHRNQGVTTQEYGTEGMVSLEDERSDYQTRRNEDDKWLDRFSLIKKMNDKVAVWTDEISDFSNIINDLSEKFQLAEKESREKSTQIAELEETVKRVETKYRRLETIESKNADFLRRQLAIKIDEMRILRETLKLSEKNSKEKSDRMVELEEITKKLKDDKRRLEVQYKISESQNADLRSKLEEEAIKSVEAKSQSVAEIKATLDSQLDSFTAPRCLTSNQNDHTQNILERGLIPVLDPEPREALTQPPSPAAMALFQTKVPENGFPEDAKSLSLADRDQKTHSSIPFKFLVPQNLNPRPWIRGHRKMEPIWLVRAEAGKNNFLEVLKKTDVETKTIFNSNTDLSVDASASVENAASVELVQRPNISEQRLIPVWKPTHHEQSKAPSKAMSLFQNKFSEDGSPKSADSLPPTSHAQMTHSLFASTEFDFSAKAKEKDDFFNFFKYAKTEMKTNFNFSNGTSMDAATVDTVAAVASVETAASADDDESVSAQRDKDRKERESRTEKNKSS